MKITFRAVVFSLGIFLGRIIMGSQMGSIIEIIFFLLLFGVFNDVLRFTADYLRKSHLL